MELFFVKPGLKVNRQYHWDMLLSHQMIAAIKHADDNFVFQWDSTLCILSATVQLLQSEPVVPKQPTAEPQLLQNLESNTAVTYELWVNKVEDIKQRDWVSSFLTAHQHILGYLVPFNGVEDLTNEDIIKAI